MAKTVYRCKQGMAGSIKGVRFHFAAGALVLEDHPVNPATNANFEEISGYVERISQPRHRGVVVERASAEPGEKRRIGRPRGSKSKQADEANQSAPEAQEEVTDGQE